MKNISSALQAHLDSRCTTLAYCWKIARKDGQIQGFSEHDRDLVVDTTTYLATSGFVPGQIEHNLGLAIGNMNVEGALSSQTINESDIAHGLYDDADVEMLLVNWADTSQFAIVSKGNIGEVRRYQNAFSAEIRSRLHRLTQKTGRVYQSGCDADVGDQRCAIDLDLAINNGQASILASESDRILTVSGLSAFEDGWFSGGLATITAGGNDTLRFEIKRHTNEASEVKLEFWRQTPKPLLVGDTLNITVGCDKQFSTCAAKFSNTINFRGFPHMPGDDFATRYASQGDQQQDGGSYYGN